MEKYVLVVLPPKDVADVVDTFRQQYARYTHYKIPPHITIYPPFFNLLASEGLLRGAVAEGVERQSVQRISIRGIGTFEGENNVVYLDPSVNSKKYLAGLMLETRAALEEKVKNAFGDYPTDQFNPHMTIAEHIPTEKLLEIKTSLQQENIRLAFLVTSLSLFRQMDKESGWHLVTNIKLRNS